MKIQFLAFSFSVTLVQATHLSLVHLQWVYKLKFGVQEGLRVLGSKVRTLGIRGSGIACSLEAEEVLKELNKMNIMPKKFRKVGGSQVPGL